MSDWDKFTGKEKSDPSNDARQNSLFKAFRRGEQIANATWTLIIREAEKQLAKGDEVEATVLTLVAARAIYAHAEKAMAAFAKKHGTEDNAPLQAMQLIDAVFKANDPAEAVAAMHKWAKDKGYEG